MGDAALFDALPEATVAATLLPYLRTQTGVPGLAFGVAPARMLGGFDPLVYGFELCDAPAALAGALVLRIYRDAQGPERARREGSVQNAVGALGFPTPAVRIVCEDRSVVAGAFQIMQRLPGRVMLDAFLGPRVLRMPAVLADLQARLHELDARVLERALTGSGCETDLCR